MTPRLPRDLERILVVRMDNLGDVLLVAPAVAALGRAFPAATLTLLASPSGSRAAPLIPGLDRTITHRASWQHAPGRGDVDDDRALIRELEQKRFDAAFIFTSFSQTPFPPAFACYLAGVPVRAAQAAEFGGDVVTHQASPAPVALHQRDRNLHLLERLGIPVDPADTGIALPAGAREALPHTLARAGLAPDRPYALIAPGAGCAPRRYPAGRFGAVARGLLAAGLQVLVVGEPGDVARTNTVLDDAPGARSLDRGTTVVELAALVSGAAVVVSNNSAPMHLAAAFGRPCVVAYSGTDLVSQWHTPSPRSRALQQPVPCSPCYAQECPRALECLDIPPHLVTTAALHVAQSWEQAA